MSHVLSFHWKYGGVLRRRGYIPNSSILFGSMNHPAISVNPMAGRSMARAPWSSVHRRTAHGSRSGASDPRPLDDRKSRDLARQMWDFTYQCGILVTPKSTKIHPSQTISVFKAVVWGILDFWKPPKGCSSPNVEEHREERSQWMINSKP